jgi:hypothetical protein
MPGWNPISDDAFLIEYFGVRKGDLATALQMELSFYPRARLAMLQNKTDSEDYCYYIAGQSIPYRLDGPSPPIHRFNADNPIRLTEQNCIEYLGFFTFFVRGEGGPFLCMGDGTLDEWLKRGVVVLSSELKPIATRFAHPPRFHGTNNEGAFHLSTLIFMAMGPFQVTFS